MNPERASERAGKRDNNIPNNSKLPLKRSVKLPVCFLATYCISLAAIMMFYDNKPPGRYVDVFYDFYR